MPLTASLVVGGISAIGKAGVGIGQLLHSNKNTPVRPEFDIQQEYFDNRDITARMAAGGLTDKSLDFYSDQAGRGLTTSTNAILQAGGGVNAVAGAIDQYQQGVRSIAAEDAERQQKNILAFIDRNDALAKQKVQKWVIDKYEPYKDQTKANAQERSAGMQNLFGGLSEATGLLAGFSTADNYEELLGSNAANRTDNTGEGKPATARTTYYINKPSAEYGDFVSPFEVPDVTERQAQVRKSVIEPTEWDPSIFSDEVREQYSRLYNFN